MQETRLAALRALARQLVAAHGEPVTYRRAGQVVGPAGGGSLRAVRGRRAGASDQGTSAPVSADGAEWLFLPGDLQLAGEVIFPALGDEVETAAAEVYDAAEPAGLTAGAYTDQFKTFVRLRTVRR